MYIRIHAYEKQKTIWQKIGLFSALLNFQMSTQGRVICIDLAENRFHYVGYFLAGQAIIAAIERNAVFITR